MCNFLEINDQLEQNFLPVACDEGVYKLALPIKLLKHEEMKPLFIMLGDFDMEKVVYSCIGKYLDGSGIDNVFIETGLFGENVTQQMLYGNHYSRAVKAIFYLVKLSRDYNSKLFLPKND